jgi:hypothetical protein
VELVDRQLHLELEGVEVVGVGIIHAIFSVGVGDEVVVGHGCVLVDEGGGGFLSEV